MDLHLKLKIVTKNEKTIEHYTMKFRSTPDNLATVGEPYFKRDMVLYTLERLDASYNSFVSSITMPMQKELITFKDF